MNEINNIIESDILSGFLATPEKHGGGKWVKAFEEEVRNYYEVKYAIAVNSATSALHVSLVACGIEPGDEVIVSPYSFSSSASCVLMVGATPVFVDIEEDTYCIDPDRIEEAITPRTKAIIPVHLFGQPCDMVSIMKIAKKYNLKVIEDASQSIGATCEGILTGTWGDCGVLSFNQNKQVSVGEGGMILTNRSAINHIARAVRNHAEVSMPHLKMVGYNYRMCEIEAYLGWLKFQDIDDIIEEQQFEAGLLNTLIEPNPPVIREGCTHSFYIYAVRTDKDLTEVGFTKGYVEPLYKLPIYKRLDITPLPVVELIQQDIWVKIL